MYHGRRKRFFSSSSHSELPIGEHTRQFLISKLQILSISSALIALHMIILNFEDGHKSLETMQSANLINPRRACAGGLL